MPLCPRFSYLPVYKMSCPSHPVRSVPAAQETIARLDQFRRFYVVVIGYLYFTRFAVFIVGVTTPYSYIWTGDFFQELATLCFYTWTGWLEPCVPPFAVLPLGLWCQCWASCRLHGWRVWLLFTVLLLLLLLLLVLLLRAQTTVPV